MKGSAVQGRSSRRRSKKDVPEVKVKLGSITRRQLEVCPEEIKVLAGGTIRFVAEDVQLAVVAQYNLDGKTHNDQTPFANNVFIIFVPKGHEGKLVRVKSRRHLPRRGGDEEECHTYKYAVVGVSETGHVAFADPIIIIRNLR